MGSPASRRAALMPPKPAPTITTRGVELLAIPPPYKIVEMAAGYKSFPSELDAQATSAQQLLDARLRVARPGWKPWLETLWVFALLEAVMWTPRSFGHSVLIALVTISPLWLNWKSGLSGKAL